MRKRSHLLIILGLLLLTYFNSLFNGFTGDAEQLFLHGSFYSDPGNLPRVFSRDFVMRPENLQAGLMILDDETPQSGCISYRPVTALTFFSDAFLWRDRPFGYHLTNLILHALVCLLIYLLTVALTASPATALLAALLFGCHPIQAEVVNSVGYRSDLLAALLFFACLAAYDRFRRTGRRLYLGLSFVFCALAPFAKESAVALPLVVILFDILFHKKEGLRDFFKSRIFVFWSFLLTGAAYLYVYFALISNSFYPRMLLFGPTYFDQLKMASGILCFYLHALVNPFFVKILPPLYAPDFISGPVWPVFAAAVLIAAGLITVIRTWNRYPLAAFCILLFVLTYFPVSNLVPLLNPMAFRFMYLPSAGLLILAAAGLSALTRRLACPGPDGRRQPSVLARLIPFSLVGILISVTLPLNAFFKNSVVAAHEMIRNFPDSSRPYWILGLGYRDRRRYSEAVEYLKRYLSIDPRNPYVLDPQKNDAVYHLLARCYRNDLAHAIPAVRKAVELNPDHLLARADLARLLILDGKPGEALDAARAIIKQDPHSPIGYVYAAHAALALDRPAEARDYVNKAMRLAPEDENVRYLKNRLLPSAPLPPPATFREEEGRERGEGPA